MCSAVLRRQRSAPLSECINNKMRLKPRGQIVLIAVLGFCLLEALDWAGITRGGFPSNWSIALVQVGVNIGWTAFATTVSYFVMIRPRRSSSAEDRHGPAHGSEGQGDSRTGR